jgi:type II secretory pathway predicted ATPase ExeA
MYLSHFELQEKPFKISTDPKFLWLGEKHKEALATLLYGILYNDGYVVVTGDVGTGKTTLASALMTELGEKVLAVKVPFPDFDSLDFFKLISTAYGIGEEFQTKGSFFALFESFLRSSSAAGQKVVLILDEAQRLTPEHLKELLSLSNIEEKGARLLNLVFVGQNEFNDILLEDSNRALRQRITINYNLGTLTLEETGQYIAHRLLVAQGKTEIFPPEAIAEVFSFSQGIPRLINVVCDLALLMTFFEGEKTVSAKTVRECVERLRLPSERGEGGGKTVPPEPEAKEAVRIEIERKTDDEEPPPAEMEEERKRLWPRVLMGAALFCFILAAGWVLFSPREERPRQEAKAPEPKAETGPQDLPGEKETEKAGGKDASEPALPAAKEAAVRPPSLPAAKVFGEGAPGKKPGVEAGGEKKKETPAAKPAPAMVRPPSAAPVPAKSEPREREKPREIREQPSAAEQSGGMGPASAPPAARESAGQAADDMDPNRVIEWLIERRSEKK